VQNDNIIIDVNQARSSPDHEVVIVGAGFSGIGAGIKLKRNGVDDFVILERAELETSPHACIARPDRGRIHAGHVTT
jgi:2-polyprenyl-6-methoxyphenol hydroxylase-like FAD-dependent oxidoreductase